MNKPRQAKLSSVQEHRVTVSDLATAAYWIATDTAGRRFRAPTKEEAVQMLNEYNHIKESK